MAIASKISFDDNRECCNYKNATNIDIANESIDDPSCSFMFPLGHVFRLKEKTVVYMDLADIGFITSL